MDLIIFPGPGDSKLTVQTVEATVETTGGGASVDVTDFFPANSIILGLTARINTALSGSGLTTWSLGNGSDNTVFGNALSKDAATQVTSRLATYNAPGAVASLRKLRVSADAGVFSSGSIHVVAFCLVPTPPTS